MRECDRQRSGARCARVRVCFSKVSVGSSPIQGALKSWKNRQTASRERRRGLRANPCCRPNRPNQRNTSHWKNVQFSTIDVQVPNHQKQGRAANNTHRSTALHGTALQPPKVATPACWITASNWKSAWNATTLTHRAGVSCPGRIRLKARQDGDLTPVLTHLSVKDQHQRNKRHNRARSWKVGRVECCCAITTSIDVLILHPDNETWFDSL